MVVKIENCSKVLTFRSDSENKVETPEIVKDDLVKTLKTDEFVESDSVEISNKPKKKKNLGKKIFLGIISSLVLIYGGIVLKHKISKPSFEEIQKCFKEIFDRDLSKEEINNLLDKYKKLVKNDKTEDFAKELIEELKKDYGIGQVETKVNVELLKDGKLKTMLNHTELGNANPLGDINIMPRTNSNVVVRSSQKEIFNTGFHELKHMKQFADAYRANPEEFVNSLYKKNVRKEDINEVINSLKEEIKKEAIESQKDEICKGMSLEKIEKLLEEGFLKKYKTYENAAENTIKTVYKELLDERYGKLARFAEGSAEYKKGMEYIEAYANYTNHSVDYEAYKNNLLEKEAFNAGDLSGKIYNYLKSIWKI